MPLFLSVGVGVSAVVPPIVSSGALFGGCGRCFGFLWENIWLCTNSAHNQFYGFKIGVWGLWWGWVSLLGGLVGCWLSRVDCWQLRKGVAESLVTTAARVPAVDVGFRRLARRSVPVAFRLGSVAVRPAVPARPLPFCLWCCVRVAPVALSALPCRCRIWSGCLSVWGLGSARCVAVARWLLCKWLPLPPFFLGSSPLLFFFPLKPLLFYYYSIS